MLRTDRRGFALPMVILLIGFLTAGAMAAFSRAGVESRAIDNQRADQIALLVATQGLERHLARPGKALQDTVAYVIGQDTAYAWARRVHKPALATDTATFFLQSEGRFRGGSGPGRPPATRTVSILAHRVGNTFKVLSAWTSLTHLIKSGNSGIISGVDAGTCPDKEGNVVAGASAPSFNGHLGPFAGNPAVDSAYTPETIKTTVSEVIDWHGFTDPASATFPKLTPTYMHCTPSSPSYIPNLSQALGVPCGQFPPASAMQGSEYPVIIVNGDYNQDVKGQGTLIVTGNLTIKGNSDWRGIILTGGWLRDDGVSDIEGAVMSGLNVLKGESVDYSSIGHGVKTYKYNSCAVADAADGMGRFERLGNTWADNRWGG